MAHLGGAVTAAAWIWVVPNIRGAARGTLRDMRRGAWQRKMSRMREEQAEVDRILRKIREHGITSLTRSEKKALADATRRQQEEEQGADRRF